MARLQIVGEDRGQGALIAASPWLRAEDFRSRVDFASALNRVLLDCRGAGWLKGPSVVVFPGLVGAGLTFVDEWPWVYSAAGWDAAVLRAMLDEKVWATLDVPFSPEPDRPRILQRRLIKMNSRKASAAFDEVLTGLSRDHNALIAAGGPPLAGAAAPLRLFSPEGPAAEAVDPEPSDTLSARLELRPGAPAAVFAELRGRRIALASRPAEFEGAALGLFPAPPGPLSAVRSALARFATPGAAATLRGDLFGLRFMGGAAAQNGPHRAADSDAPAGEDCAVAVWL